MHGVKAAYHGSISPPILQKTLKKQKKFIKRLFKDLSQMQPSHLTGCRIEFRFEENYSIAELCDFDSNNHSLRNITPTLYIALLKEVIEFVKHEDLFRGRDSTRLSSSIM
jgi:hypothetical protein